MRLIAAVVLAAPLFAQHGRYVDSKNPAMGNPEAIAAGAKQYATSCAACHGPDGSGGRGPNLVRRALWHPLKDEDIFNLIRNGIPGADMPATKLADDQTWNLVAFIHAMTGPAIENTVPGNPAAGEQIFWGAKAGCGNCHPIRGKGGRVGPDLTNVGGSRPLAVIKENVVDPGKPLTFLGREGITVTLRNGEVIKGIARNRSNYSLQVTDRKGDLHMINMADVREIQILDRPVMPTDYAKRLSADEMRDLLAYLAKQSVRPAGAATKGAN